MQNLAIQQQNEPGEEDEHEHHFYSMWTDDPNMQTTDDEDDEESEIGESNHQHSDQENESPQEEDSEITLTPAEQIDKTDSEHEEGQWPQASTLILSTTTNQEGQTNETRKEDDQNLVYEEARDQLANENAGMQNLQEILEEEEAARSLNDWQSNATQSFTPPHSSPLSSRKFNATTQSFIPQPRLPSIRQLDLPPEIFIAPTSATGIQRSNPHIRPLDISTAVATNLRAREMEKEVLQEDTVTGDPFAYERDDASYPTLWTNREQVVTEIQIPETEAVQALTEAMAVAMDVEPSETVTVIPTQDIGIREQRRRRTLSETNAIMETNLQQAAALSEANLLKRTDTTRTVNFKQTRTHSRKSYRRKSYAKEIHSRRGISTKIWQLLGRNSHNCRAPRFSPRLSRKKWTTIKRSKKSSS